MKRNLESRVEVVVPVEDPALRQELRTVLDAQLAPDHGAWEMQPDGTYVRGREGARSSQQVLVDQAEKRQKEASRRRKRRPRGFARRAAK
jgi:polyphosphate kinase